MVLAPNIEAPSPGRPADDHATVLIVDDSAVTRAVLTRMIDASGRFVVVRALAQASAAIEFLKTTRVDAILLDLEMPGMDGLTALPELLAVGRGAQVLVVSSAAAEGGAVTIQALALGAADTMVKPDAGMPSKRFAESLIEKLGRLVERHPIVPLPELWPRPAARPAAAPRAIGDGYDSVATGEAYDMVAIGASTGGIHALGQLLRNIPAGFRLPLLVTQHLPATFMPYYAAQVATLGSRPCDVAIDRMRLRPGRIVVAPGDAHVRIVSLGDGAAAVRLSHEPVSSGCMPSVDPMFETLAAVFGSRALAIILSGMGRDGVEGARCVRAAGGCVVVQDQASSVVWGMPGAIAAAGLADAILAPDAIGALVASQRRP